MVRLHAAGSERRRDGSAPRLASTEQPQDNPEQAKSDGDVHEDHHELDQMSVDVGVGPRHDGSRPLGQTRPAGSFAVRRQSTSANSDNAVSTPETHSTGSRCHGPSHNGQTADPSRRRSPAAAAPAGERRQQPDQHGDDRPQQQTLPELVQQRRLVGATHDAVDRHDGVTGHVQKRLRGAWLATSRPSSGSFHAGRSTRPCMLTSPPANTRAHILHRRRSRMARRVTPRASVRCARPHTPTRTDCRARGYRHGRGHPIRQVSGCTRMLPSFPTYTRRRTRAAARGLVKDRSRGLCTHQMRSASHPHSVVADDPRTSAQRRQVARSRRRRRSNQAKSTAAPRRPGPAARQRHRSRRRPERSHQAQQEATGARRRDAAVDSREDGIGENRPWLSALRRCLQGWLLLSPLVPRPALAASGTGRPVQR